MKHVRTKARLVTFIATMAALLAGGVPGARAGRIRCCLPGPGNQCSLAPAKRCTRLGGVNLGPGTCAPDTCAAVCNCCTTAPRFSFTTGMPSSSTVTGTVEDDTGATLLNLTAGGLYFGGAAVGVPLPAVIPDMGQSILKVSSCNPTTGALTLAATTQTDIGGAHPNRTCTAAGVINPEYPGKTGCLFGPPLPIPNPNAAATSTCVVNRVVKSASGTGSCNDGSSAVDLPLLSDLYLTGDLLPAVTGIQPCPLCTGPSGSETCQGGPNAGQPCTPGDSASLGDAYPTSHDCPPPAGAFIGSLPIPFALSTGTQMKTSQDFSAQPFVFCGFCGKPTSPSFQGPPAVPCMADADCTDPNFPACRQRDSGAFGQGPARTITENGSPANACIADGTPHTSTLVSVFCIPPTFNGLVDGAGDLPGPGAVALPGSTQLQ